MCIRDRFQCGVCGFVYDEEKEGKPFEDLKECPVCRQPASVFAPLKDVYKRQVHGQPSADGLDALTQKVKPDKDFPVRLAEGLHCRIRCV